MTVSASISTTKDKILLTIGSALAISLSFLIFEAIYESTNYLRQANISHSIIPISLASFFLWRVRFEQKSLNILLAVTIVVFASSSWSMICLARLRPVCYFIIINSMCFLPVAAFLSVVENKEKQWLSSLEQESQNKHYRKLFVEIIFFSKLFFQLFKFLPSVSERGKMQLEERAIFLSLGILLSFLILYAFILNIFFFPLALAIAWTLILFRLQRDMTGIVKLLFIVLTFSTIYGAVMVFTQNAYDSPLISLSKLKKMFLWLVVVLVLLLIFYLNQICSTLAKALARGKCENDLVLLWSAER